MDDKIKDPIYPPATATWSREEIRELSRKRDLAKYATVEVDRKALAASKQEPYAFKNYAYQKMLVVTDDIREQMEAQKMFCINTDNIYIRPTPPDTRSKCKKLIDETKRRLSNAWQMLKGADWE